MYYFNMLQLVDLKAELYRKQEQFKREKIGQENAESGHKTKVTSKVKVKYVLEYNV